MIDAGPNQWSLQGWEALRHEARCRQLRRTPEYHRAKAKAASLSRTAVESIYLGGPDAVTEEAWLALCDHRDDLNRSTHLSP